MPREHIHFVTGSLAEPALRGVVQHLSEQLGFNYSIDVLRISVAALMTTRWAAPRIRPPEETSRIILPGYCRGAVVEVADAVGKPVEMGPRDLRRLPEFFSADSAAPDLQRYDIEILAEINHAPELSPSELVVEAQRLAAEGADMIDLGCNPGDRWLDVGDAVRRLRDLGLRVSIDSFDADEVADAVSAGAELVLSVNRENCERAADWGCEVVAIPDEPDDLESLYATIEQLEKSAVRYRLDPILSPLGCGFAESLRRCFELRRRYPDAELLLGVGNVTELMDCDSGGVNFLLLGFCQEVGVRSVLTTQVINWARTSVRECDLARRMVYAAVAAGTPPKHFSNQLVILRDERVAEFGAEALAKLASQIKDRNVRVFVDGGRLHLLSEGKAISGDDPFDLFRRLSNEASRGIDASHAFYLGYELAKATTALTLGKEYRQDEALDWGFLTRPEPTHRGGADATADDAS